MKIRIVQWQWNGTEEVRIFSSLNHGAEESSIEIRTHEGGFPADGRKVAAAEQSSVILKGRPTTKLNHKILDPKSTSKVFSPILQNTDRTDTVYRGKKIKRIASAGENPESNPENSSWTEVSESQDRNGNQANRPILCTFCLKPFMDIHKLMKHERYHMLKKRFKCKFCEKSFNIHTNLVVHTRTHTGERPYRCSFCLKSFSQMGGLKSHERTHFAQSGHLQKHEGTDTSKINL